MAQVLTLSLSFASTFAFSPSFLVEGNNLDWALLMPEEKLICLANDRRAQWNYKLIEAANAMGVKLLSLPLH